MDLVTVLVDKVLANFDQPVVVESFEDLRMCRLRRWQLCRQSGGWMLLYTRGNASTIVRDACNFASEVIVGHSQVTGRFKLNMERAICTAFVFTRLFPGHSVSPAVVRSLPT